MRGRQIALSLRSAGVRAASVSFVALLLAFACPAARAQTADSVKVGFITTLSGSAGVLGQHMYDGFMLRVDQNGGKLGGLRADIIKGDDQFKPDIGLKISREMIERDHVDFITGFVFSNVLLAALRPALEAQTFVLSGNAGPADYAGVKCSPYFFGVAYENDMNDEAAGVYYNQLGVKRVYLMAPNYITGRDALAGFKRTFKGEIVGETYTKLDQMDYSAELTQMAAAKPDAAYVFFPGGFGVNFIKQFYQAGLRSSIPLLSKATVDLTNLPAQGEAALGSKEITHWNWDLDNPANKEFVAAYRKKYGYTPSIFSEASYDVSLILDKAIADVHGNLKDKDALRKAMEQAGIQSPRGPFKFNTNHFPIHDQYVVEAKKLPDGQITLVYQGNVRENAQDSFVNACHMK
jgi:branched-chain amino acid transport system substrate-binding protein